MIKKILLAAVVFPMLLLLAGCRAAPIYNIEDKPINEGRGATMSQVEAAILKGCKAAGWRARVHSPGKILAAYAYKRSRYEAIVEINYDQDSYAIHYKSSSNLKFKEGTNEPGAGSFFDDIISSDGANDDQPGGSQTIHKAYNEWVQELERNIDVALLTLPSRGPGAYAQARDFNESRSARGYGPCNSPPSMQISGEGTVNRASVNVRNGANRQCPRAGSVHKGERFELLGQLDNWYQIRFGQDLTGWIYAPLVTKLASSAPSYSAPSYSAPSYSARSYAATPTARSSSVTSPPPSYAAQPSYPAQSSYSPPPPPPPPVVSAPAPPPVVSAPSPVSAAPRTTATASSSKSVALSDPDSNKKISIAVIQFKTLNKEAQDLSLGDLVSETFTSALVNSSGFRIIEREQLNKVIREMELSQTGIIETTNAVSIGKILHADAIITGSVALLGDQLQLNARIIDIESAYVISAETKTTTYTLENVTSIVEEIVGTLSSKLND